MKATLSNYRQSPLKTRLVANLILGKSVQAALSLLEFLPKKSSPMFRKLLNSAVSNARNAGIAPDSLVVQSVEVNKGLVIRRFMPKARGRASGIRRTRSVISLQLGVASPKKNLSHKLLATS